MDLLYSKYSNPLEFMNIYINQGRFGEFVENVIELNYKKQKEEVEREDENKLFNMYVHSCSDVSFKDWKEKVLKNSVERKSALSMTDKQVDAAIEKSRDILKKFNPK